MSTHSSLTHFFVSLVWPFPAAISAIFSGAECQQPSSQKKKQKNKPKNLALHIAMSASPLLGPRMYTLVRVQPKRWRQQTTRPNNPSAAVSKQVATPQGGKKGHGEKRSQSLSINPPPPRPPPSSPPPHRSEGQFLHGVFFFCMDRVSTPTACGRHTHLWIYDDIRSRASDFGAETCWHR